jgi:ABC-type phosphonate transport system ATPase subunit
MNAAAKLVPTEQLLTLTQEMLTSAQASDWDKLVELEKTRLPLLNQVFSQGIADHVELARELLSIDEQTKSLAVAEMPVVQDELLKMKNSNKASTAYQTIQGFTASK